MAKMFLICGIPGSGKSTKAEEIKAKYLSKPIEHYEADMFFYVNGEYKWNPKKLHYAHQWCKNAVEIAMKNGNDVIVSNTFLTKVERAPYFELAKKYNYNIQVIECNGNFKNIHGVSDEKVELMRKKYQKVDLNEY